MVSDSYIFPQKAIVLIDGCYLQKIQKRLGIKRVDVLQLSKELCKPAFRIRTNYYDARRGVEKQSFHDALQRLDRFTVVLGEVKKREIWCEECGKTISIDMQKGVDVALAVDMVHIASTKQVDMIVLIAGDQDFLPAIKTARKSGIILRLAYQNESVSQKILLEVDERIELTEQYMKRFAFELAQDDHDEHDHKKRVQVVNKKEQEKARITVIKTIKQIIMENHDVNHNQWILISQLGNKLREVQPNWKEKTGYAKLIDLVESEGNRDLVTKKNEERNQVLVSIKTLATTTNNSDYKEIISFILNLIQESASQSIYLSQLGLALSKSFPEEKKRIKSLSKFIQKNIPELTINADKTMVSLKALP